MFDIMDAMVIMAWHAHTDISDKELKRLAYKLTKKSMPAVSAGFLHVLQNAKNPRAELEFHATGFLDLLAACSEISQMGHDCIGLLIYESNAYPVRIEFTLDTLEEQQEDAQWLLQNEMKLMSTIVLQAKKVFQVRKIDCKVLLFNNRGFSGILTPISL